VSFALVPKPKPNSVCAKKMTANTLMSTDEHYSIKHWQNVLVSTLIESYSMTEKILPLGRNKPSSWAN
jgi:hypothetical protein